MSAFHVLKAKIIDNEDEHDGSPLVPPEAWCCGTLVVAMWDESFGEEVVGKFACLFESIDALVDLKVYPPMMGKGVEVIFGNKLVRDDGELYLNILRAVEWGAEIEV